MIKMKSLRAFRLASTTGHVKRIVVGENDVHDDLVKDAMAAGMVPVDAKDATYHEDKSKAKVDFTGDVRASILHLALKSVAEENDMAKFDAGGSPKVAVINEMLGMQIGKKELNEGYQQYLTIKSEGGDFVLHANSPNIIRVLEAESGKELKALGEELGYDQKKLEGQSEREMRRLLLVKLSGNSTGS